MTIIKSMSPTQRPNPDPCGQMTFAMQEEILCLMMLYLPWSPHRSTMQCSFTSVYKTATKFLYFVSRQSTAAAGREGLYCFRFRQMKVYEGS